MKKLVLSILIIMSTPLYGRIKDIIDTQEFRTTISAPNKKCVAKFYLETCPACRAVKKAFEDASNENADATFICVDTNAADQLSREYNVQSLPTIAYFKNGKEIKSLRHTGSEAYGSFKSRVAGNIRSMDQMANNKKIGSTRVARRLNARNAQIM